MPDLLQVAQLMFDGAQQRLTTASTNIAQAQTPGYKRSISFSTFVTPELLAAQHGAMSGSRSHRLEIDIP